jgi:hypothetical protein
MYRAESKTIGNCGRDHRCRGSFLDASAAESAPFADHEATRDARRRDIDDRRCRNAFEGHSQPITKVWESFDREVLSTSAFEMICSGPACILIQTAISHTRKRREPRRMSCENAS